MLYYILAVVAPSTSDHIGIFYLFWMLAFIGINIIWDIISSKTEKFHLKKMSNKVSVIYNAATFCSSLLLCLAIVEPAARALAGDTAIVFVLAGFSGVAQSIGAICPYEI